MAQGKKVTEKQWNEFLKVLGEMIGLIGATCRKVGISRWTYYDHRSKDKEFAKSADLAISQMGVAFAADKLLEAVSQGEGWAIKFFLMCKSKEWRPY